MSFLMKWLPIRRKPPTRTRTAMPRLERLEDRLVPTVTFHGGNVLANVEVQALYYGNDFVNNPAVSGQVGQFENALQSIARGPYLDTLARAGYNVGAGSFDAGKVLLTDPGSTLKDSDIRKNLQSAIQSGGLESPDNNRLYVVVVGPNVKVINDDYTDPKHPKVFDDSVTDFVGYHGAFAGVDAEGDTGSIRYAVLPTAGGTVNNGYANLGLSAFDSMTVTASHEIAEGATNPDVNFGKVGWRDDSMGKQEIGDLAAGNNVRLNGLLVQELVDQSDNLIFPADLHVTGTTFQATAGEVFFGQVATAFDTYGLTQVSNLTGTISWGDGTNSTAYVQYDPSGLFPVTGTHTYATAGSYQMTVVVGDTTNTNSVNSGPSLAQVRYNYHDLVSDTYNPNRPSDYVGYPRSAYEVQAVHAVNTGYSGLAAVAAPAGADQAVVSQPAVLSYPPSVIDLSAPLPDAVLAIAVSTPDASLADNSVLATVAADDPTLAAVNDTSLAVALSDSPPAAQPPASFDSTLSDAVFADTSTSWWEWALNG